MLWHFVLLATAKAVFQDEDCLTEDLEFQSEGFVLQVRPRGVALDAKWLSAWTSLKSECLKKAFFEHGALVFRGFNVSGAPDFEQVALALVPNLERVYLGTSPRSQINGTSYVFTAADFQPHRTVPVHLEMSFKDSPPATQLFYAKQVEQWQGGETPLTDFQAVWEELSQDPELRKTFESRKVKYIRNMADCGARPGLDPLVQKCWQKMFENEQDARIACESENFNCSWDQTKRLRIINSQPFIRTHPVTGHPVFFNHINVLHGGMMPGDYERTASLWSGSGVYSLWPQALALYYHSLFRLYDLIFPETEMGSTAVKEDGQSFSAAELKAMKQAIHRHTVNHAYQKHDIVMVDNLRIGHGREIYLGPKDARQIYTAWSEEYPPLWHTVRGAGDAGSCETQP